MHLNGTNIYLYTPLRVGVCITKGAMLYIYMVKYMSLQGLNEK